MYIVELKLYSLKEFEQKGRRDITGSTVNIEEAKAYDSPDARRKFCEWTLTYLSMY